MSDRFSPAGCEDKMNPAFCESDEFGSHFWLRRIEPVPRIHDRTVVVENDSYETSAP